MEQVASNKMKTAIQLLDDYLSEKLSVDATEDPIESAKLDVYAEIGNLIGELLAKEKRDLIDFHIECMKIGLINEGVSKWIDGYKPIITEVAENYYTETFTK